jgi:hypothetical protein
MKSSAAFFGTAFSGHMPAATSLTWPNGNSESAPTQPAGTQVAVNDWTYGNGSGNTGLTISKLISAMVALDAAEGDEGEERYIAVKGQHKGQLLATTEATSADYNTVKALVNGTDRHVHGLQVQAHRTPAQNGSAQIACRPGANRGAMGLGVGADIVEPASRNVPTRASAGTPMFDATSADRASKR